MTESAYRLLFWVLVVAGVIQGIAIIRTMEWPPERWFGAW